MTPQQRLDRDQRLLQLWAEAESYDIRHGYERIALTHRISIKRAKKEVHEAIVRDGGNPHNSPGLVRAWMINRKRAAKTIDLQ